MSLREKLHSKLLQMKSSQESLIRLENWGKINLRFSISNRDFLVGVVETTNNPQNQINDAMHDLYEYRYLQNIPQAKLVLAIEHELPPKVQWMQDYLEYDRDISLIWDGGDQLFASEKTRNELAFLWGV